MHSQETEGRSSIEPDESCRVADRGEKISSGFIVAHDDGPKLLEPAEEVLEQAASFVVVSVVRARLFALGLCGNDWFYFGVAESRRQLRRQTPLLGRPS